MNKRLILVLALVFVAGLTMAAYAEVQNVKVSGDLTVLGASRKMGLTSTTKADDPALAVPTTLKDRGKDNFMASITRVRIDADLTDNVSTTVRLLNERYWGTETDNFSTTGTNSDIDLDLAYATMKEFLYSPLTLTIGRQELHFGNDMIVGDPDTNNMASIASPFGNTIPTNGDLTVRKAFDAIRATLNYDPLVIDGVVAIVSNVDNSRKDDQNLYGINVGYDLNKKTKLEGYWFERRNGRDANTTEKVSRTDTLGGRVAVTAIDNDDARLLYQLESAFQFGQVAGTTLTPSAPRKAWALETSLSYDWKKVKYAPSATICYAYFSGEDQNSYSTNAGTFKGWDPMYENQTTGHIANALFNQTGVQLFGASVSAKPKDDVTLKGEYYAYFWTKEFAQFQQVFTVRNPGTVALNPDRIINMTDKRFAGQEIDGTVTYDYTEDVQFGLLGGMFFPGPSFDKRNANTAMEVIGSMKVTF